MTRKSHPSWRPRHEEVLLWMLRTPRGTQKECAEATGYTRWQISRIVNSPGFKERFEEAQQEVRARAYGRSLFL